MDLNIKTIMLRAQIIQMQQEQQNKEVDVEESGDEE